MVQDCHVQYVARLPPSCCMQPNSDGFRSSCTTGNNTRSSASTCALFIVLLKHVNLTKNTTILKIILAIVLNICNKIPERDDMHFHYTETIS